MDGGRQIGVRLRLQAIGQGTIMALEPFYVAQQLMEGTGIRGVALFVRHGETAWNCEGRVMGNNPVELNDRGRAQVEAVAQLLCSIKPTLIVTSPLVRARQSAEIIANRFDRVEIIEEPQIAEVQYGRWEGMTYPELISDSDYLSYRQSPLDTLAPGGETVRGVQRRGVEAVNRFLSANSDCRVVFVSHGDIIRTVLCHLIGLELDHFHRIRIDNATLSAVQVAGKFAELKFLNLLPDPGRAFVSPFPIRKT
jgi:phosphoserine phosphatase